MPSLDALGSAFTLARQARTIRPSATVPALASLATGVSRQPRNDRATTGLERSCEATCSSPHGHGRSADVVVPGPDRYLLPLVVVAAFQSVLA
jgi:hypothetical protein